MTAATALAVFAGSAVGGAARFAVSRRYDPVDHQRLPAGTLAVNLIGCFLIGLASGWAVTPLARGFVVVGVLGGFTTVSAFGLQTVGMIERGRFAQAFAYALASLLGGLAAFALAARWVGAA